MRRIGAALLLAVILAPAAGLPADACSCLARTPLEQLSTADAVFTGRLSAVNGPVVVTSSMDPVTYRFDVSRVIKGAVASNVSVQTALDSVSCGIELREVGATVTVFARYVDGELHTGLCDGTHLGEADPSLTGSGTLLGPEPEGPPVTVLALALGALAFALLLATALRRRGRGSVIRPA